MSYIRQLLIQQALKRKSNRPKGLIGQYKPYLNSNDSPTRDILKDYSGRSHDIQLYNFGYALGSGYGSWAFDLSSSSLNEYTEGQSYGTLFFQEDGSLYKKVIVNLNVGDTIKFKFRVRDLIANGKPGLNLILYEASTGVFIESSRMFASSNGIFEYSFTNENYSSNLILYFYNGVGSANKRNFYVDILPDYPGALVSDGVDDYGLCENFPILTKEKGYTVVALRKWLNIDNSQGVLVSTEKDSARTGAFSMEYDSVNPLTYSFGAENKISSFKEDFTYQTSNKYNDESILSNGDFVQTDNLLLFRKRLNFSYYSSIALYALEIYDHDLTDEEIQSVKEAMYNEYLTATNALQNHIIADYECYDKTNEDEDRAVLKDLSGNGHDITLYNFGFAEGSGYGLYSTNYLNYTTVPSRCDFTITNTKIIINEVFVSNANFIETKSGVTLPKGYKVKVSGMQQNQSIKYRCQADAVTMLIDKDGVYSLPDMGENKFIGFQGLFTGPCNITIEQIPEYQGALVSDGVDDYGLCENFPILNKEDGYTIIAIRKHIKQNGIGAFVSNVSNGNINDGAFCFEYTNANGYFKYSNFGVGAVFSNFEQSAFSYQNSKVYNGTPINKGDAIGLNKITLFNINGNPAYGNNSIAFYQMKILDKDCTTEEIKFIAKQMVARHKEKTGETIELNF